VEILNRILATVLVLALCAPAAHAGSTPKAKTAKAQKEPAIEDTSAPVVSPEATKTPVAAPEPLREKKYFYSSFGTRDPFRSLVDGTFEAKLQDLVDLRTVTLVGVLSEQDEHVAMVQDAQGFGYNLRPGDRVRGGTVVSVGKDAMVARLNVFGQTTRVTLRMQREE
jgi:hypothetical protein